MTAVLEIQNLKVEFAIRRGTVVAVDNVNLSVARGQVLGLVGESGSGKTVTGLSVLGLVDPPGRVVSGSIRLNGQELVGLREEDWRAIRGKRVAMIFQDPMMTLNPVLRIDTQMMEAISAHEKLPPAVARRRCIDALGRVGIPSPEERLSSYPHQFSGGMRQRVVIAIALLNNPELIIADEPTTALDVTIQAQIVAQVQKLAAETGTAVVWVTHDLAVVSGLADTLAVMYAGRVVEGGPTPQVLNRPMHPYTLGLLDSLPGRNARGKPLNQIPGGIPSLTALPSGCPFAPRCSHVMDICQTTMPPETYTGDGRRLRCFNPITPSEAAA
jgi:peptide/nickel transport system ATP-binding protein